ncbi:hypothetical protein [Streptomyces sp. NPDC006368]|uniref:hypothetical protein n=1 Tax=Streptomyces sp. NPDC006368 TaxID=3156760 RepID=UPI0033B7A648
MQQFAARHPVLLALFSGTPVGLIVLLASWRTINTIGDFFFVLATCVAVYFAFGLTAYGERVRQQRLQRLGIWHPPEK